jgi:hypothetical protein
MTYLQQLAEDDEIPCSVSFFFLRTNERKIIHMTARLFTPHDIKTHHPSQIVCVKVLTYCGCCTYVDVDRYGLSFSSSNKFLPADLLDKPNAV